MPHLSPMNWISMLLTLWLTISIFSSLSWWSTSPLFQVMNIKKDKNLDKVWHW